MRYIDAMKHIIAAIALLAATAMPTLAQTQLDPRTQEYRMWSAEQMIERLIVRLNKLTAGCNHFQLRAYLPKVSEVCRESVISLYPQLKIIREVAASGDEVRWAEVIDIVRTLEQDTEAPLRALERK
jgi:hypothetical protein